MDQTYILTRAKLTLADGIEASKPEHGLLILKHTPQRSYLVVNEEQWRLLQRFRQSTALQDLLPHLITERKTPPLRELYELIMKAVVSGILLVDGKNCARETRAKAPVDWSQSLRFGMAHWFGVAAILFGFFSLLLNPIQTPGHHWEALAGWLVVCGALSAGYFLSACILVGFDREVYDAGFRWVHLFPHFHCNVEDARMAGRKCEMTVALMQMAPMFFLTGVAALWYPGMMYMLLYGIFYLTLPTGHSAASLLLRSVYRRYPLSTTRDFAFVQNQLLWTALNARVRFSDKSYLLIFSVFAIGWLGAVLLTNIRAFHLNLDELTTMYVASGAARVTAIVVLGLMAVAVFVSLWYLLWIAAMNLVTAAEHAFARWRTSLKLTTGHEMSGEDVVDFLRQTMLLRGQPDELLADLAGCMRGVIVSPKQVIFREGETGENLYFVVSGGVDVLMNLPSGRAMKITELSQGDVFGEIALLHNVPRTRSIRAAQKSFLLALRREDFQALIVRNIGAREVEAVIEKQAFLNRIDLCRNWHPQALSAFAHLANLAEFDPGDLVIKKNLRNQFFYLIYDGLLEVKIDGKRVAKLATGEFFGEISLLQNSTATADIVAITETRCLVVQRRDFLQFIATDFLVGLQFEEISSKRLKHPIFPLTGVAYEDFPERY